MNRPSLRAWAVALLVLSAACGVGGETGASGCLRVHQGTYDFPVKRIVKGSVLTRVTQTGLDLVTERIRDLVFGFFEADEDGHVILPLTALGLGELSSSFGPVEASVEDLVLSLDLSALEVTLIPGTSPARIQVVVYDALVGILDGQVTGTLDALLLTGDMACGLENGASGHVALLDLDMVLALATTEDGAIEVEVESLDIDIKDLDVTLVVDCDLPKCLDGLSPGSTAQCDECDLLCSAGDWVADLVAQLQDLLDDQIDALLGLLADDLANLFLDDLLNGKPVAIEGELDLSPVAGRLLPSLRYLTPLGVVGRPASDAFAISGVAGDGSLGLDLVLDAGVTANPVHGCVGDVGAVPIFAASAVPELPAVLDDGGYDLALALSAALVDEVIWSAWAAGMLCVDVTTRDVTELTAGAVSLTAMTLDLLLPGVAAIVGPDAPVRLRLRPRFPFASEGSVVNFTGGMDAPQVSVTVVDMEVALDVWFGRHFVNALTVEVDARMGLSLQTTPDGGIGLGLGDLSVDEVRVVQDDLVKGAEIDAILPFVVDVVLGLLEGFAFELEVPIAGLLEDAMGVPIATVIRDVRALGGDEDWLGIFLDLEATDGASPAQARPDEPTPWRGAGWFLPPGGGVDRLPGATPPPQRQAQPAPVALDPPEDRRGPADAGGETPGCAAGSTPASLPGALLLLGAIFALRGRRRRWAGALLAALLAAGCGGGLEAPRVPCALHAECPDDYLCGPEGMCMVATPCVDDVGCCPGAICFHGWCRPTEECDVLRPCDGLGATCDAGVCVPMMCVDGGCPAGTECVSGRCLRGSPCGGVCEPGTACHVASGRCYPAPGCDGACTEGTFAVSTSEGAVDPYTCDPGAFPCACSDLPVVPPGRPGMAPGAVVFGGEVHVFSYDVAYGDLVHSHFSGGEGVRQDRAVDGVPDGPVVGDPEGPRGGVLEPGPDVGAVSAVTLATGADGAAFEVIYRDEALGGVRYLRLTADGEPRASMALPVDGDAGHALCLTRQPDSGRLVGLVLVRVAPGGEQAQLVRVAANVETPQNTSDWTASVAYEQLLPLTSPSPCDGACGVLDACVRDPDLGDRCVGLMDGLDCSLDCGWGAVCVGDDGEPDQCMERVRAGAPGADLGAGRDLDVSCAAGPDGVVAAWVDSRAGVLVLAPDPFTAPEVLDGGGPLSPTGAVDVDVAVSPTGRVGVVYQDVRAGHVRLAERVVPGALWTLGDLPLAGGAGLEFGAGVSLRYVQERPVAVYAEVTGADIWAAHHDASGCWALAALRDTGAWAGPAVAQAPGGGLFLVASELYVDLQRVAHVDLTAATLEPPTCP